MSSIWKGHTTCSPNQGLWIGDYRLPISMASEPRYTTTWKLVAEVQDLLLPWHHRLEDYSGSMWMLQERVMGQGMYLGISDTQHRMRFQKSTPIRTAWSRRSQTHWKYLYQLEWHPWSTDHCQQLMVIPIVEILVVIRRVAIPAIVLEVHQQTEFESLGASRSVWEEVECKLRSVDIRRESDPRIAFRPAFRVTGISDDRYRSTMGAVVISLGVPETVAQSMGESETKSERCLGS